MSESATFGDSVTDVEEGQLVTMKVSSGRLSGDVVEVDPDPDPEDSLEPVHRLRGVTQNDVPFTVELMSTGRVRARRRKFQPFSNVSSFSIAQY